MERTPTGIPGFDEMVEGGIPRGYTILLAGGPGSGKSTFAMQFLYNGIEQFKEKGLYISMEELPVDIMKNFEGFGWDLSKIEIISLIPQRIKSLGDPKFVVPDISQLGEGNVYEYKNFSIDVVEDIIRARVKESNIKRVVVDSLPSMALQLNDDFVIRQEIQGLSLLLKDLGTTSLITTEMPEGQSGISRFGVEEFVSQGVIALYNVRRGSRRVRGIEVIKMRGTNHSQNISVLNFDEGGMRVFPGESLYSEF